MPSQGSSAHRMAPFAPSRSGQFAQSSQSSQSTQVPAPTLHPSISEARVHGHRSHQLDQTAPSSRRSVLQSLQSARAPSSTVAEIGGLQDQCPPAVPLHSRPSVAQIRQSPRGQSTEPAPPPVPTRPEMSLNGAPVAEYTTRLEDLLETVARNSRHAADPEHALSVNRYVRMLEDNCSHLLGMIQDFTVVLQRQHSLEQDSRMPQSEAKSHASSMIQDADEEVRRRYDASSNTIRKKENEATQLANARLQDATDEAERIVRLARMDAAKIRDEVRQEARLMSEGGSDADELFIGDHHDTAAVQPVDQPTVRERAREALDNFWGMRSMPSASAVSQSPVRRSPVAKFRKLDASSKIPVPMGPPDRRSSPPIRKQRAMPGSGSIVRQTPFGPDFTGGKTVYMIHNPTVRRSETPAIFVKDVVQNSRPRSSNDPSTSHRATSSQFGSRESAVPAASVIDLSQDNPPRSSTDPNQSNQATSRQFRTPEIENFPTGTPAASVEASQEESTDLGRSMRTRLSGSRQHQRTVPRRTLRNASPRGGAETSTGPSTAAVQRQSERLEDRASLSIIRVHPASDTFQPPQQLPVVETFPPPVQELILSFTSQERIHRDLHWDVDAKIRRSFCALAKALRTPVDLMVLDAPHACEYCVMLKSPCLQVPAGQPGNHVAVLMPLPEEQRGSAGPREVAYYVRS